LPEEPARAAAELRHSRKPRSDRFDDRHHRRRGGCAQRHRFGAAAGGEAMTGVARRAESWWQRFVRSLLYGRNVDRNAKARARVGLAILAFAAVYAGIGGPLVMFAAAADSHSAPRPAPQAAIATPPPAVVEPNGPNASAHRP